MWGKSIMKRSWILSAVLSVLAFCFLAPETFAKAKKDEAKPEFRAAWVTRFEWPDADPEKCKANIREIFENLQKANFNAAVFQVRGQADVLYPSPYEPWSPLIGGKDPGWDPLAFAIEEAHSRGIEFHAYVNPMPLWNSSTPPPRPEPGEPEHLYFKHGPEAEVSWVCHDATGSPMRVRGQGYYYLAPGIPGVHVYLRTVLLDLVQRYDLDGIHYDRIRTPGPQYSHDPISKARFQGAGNPNGMEWADWQREQLNKLIGDLYAEIAAAKPSLRVSCAAWGLYNRYEIPGYEKFSSGYHDYCQDSVAWIHRGAMDTLMPMIYWNIPDPKPNYDEVLKYFTTKVPANQVFGGQIVHKGGLKKGGTFDEIEASRELGTEGNVIFSYRSLTRDDGFAQYVRYVYPSPVPVPAMPWKEKPATGILRGHVLTSEGLPVTDATIEIEGVPRKETSSEDGFFAFTGLAPGPKTLKIAPPGMVSEVIASIDVDAGEVVQVEYRPGLDKSQAPRFRVISPRIPQRTSSDTFNVAVHTDPDCNAWVNGEEVHVFKTGIFVADGIPLQMGDNKIELKIESPNGLKITKIRWVTRMDREPREGLPALPLQFNEESAQPRWDLLIQPGDPIPVSIQGSPGHVGSFRVGRGDWQPMIESNGRYSGVYVVQPGDAFEDATIGFRLERNWEVEGKIRSPRRVEAETKGRVSARNTAIPIVAEVSAEMTDLKYGLGEVRLGGPIFSTVPRGTRLELTGRIGRAWRVRLSDAIEAWVDDRDIQLLPTGTAPARDYLTSFSVSGDERHDFISIPYGAKVPFRILPEVDPNSLLIDLFGITANTTWITIRKEEAKGIRNVDWEQVARDHYRLKVYLDYPQLWGYDARVDGGQLRITIRRPPALAAAPQSPVAGLTVAVEAGHGGPNNTGARGLSGSLEKEVNFGTATQLVNLLKDAGAKPVMVRVGDESISLGDRVKRAIEANADLFISIHANAAGSSSGYLRVKGTSTYYKYLPWRPLSESILDRLAALGLHNWGNIGSFNYRPCLMTQMPSILAELAFMSHPGDEELLVDPEFQQEMAEAIFLGLEDWLKTQRQSDKGTK